MFVLDSDYLSLIHQAESELGGRIRHSIEDVGPAEFVTTIVNFEEQTRGWLAFAAKSKSNAELIEAYRRLEGHLRVYCPMTVLAFDQSAAMRFEELKHAKIRIGTLDLRIDATVLAHG